MSRMIIAAACMLPLALSGCAATTVKGMRDRKPVLVADSTHDVTAISNCVSAAWVARGMTPQQVPRENGTTLLVQQVVMYALPLILVDLDRTSTGTHATMRIFKSLRANMDQARVDEVRACL